jgi:hypothetical protein
MIWGADSVVNQTANKLTCAAFDIEATEQARHFYRPCFEATCAETKANTRGSAHSSRRGSRVLHLMQRDVE